MERTHRLGKWGKPGIGLEVCRQLAERSYTVVMGSRDDEQGRAAAAGLLTA